MFNLKRAFDYLSKPFRNTFGVTSYSDLQNDVSNFIALKTLTLATKLVRFYEFGTKAKLDSQSGKSFTYTRYERLNLPTQSLTEGQSPSDSSMTISQVTAIAEQWGAVVTLTDVAELTIKHKPLGKAIELLALQAAETTDREIFKVLLSGTSVFFVGDPARVGIDTGDVVDSATLASVVANLRSNGAMGIEKPSKPMDDPELGDMFALIVDPFVEQDISTDEGFVESVKYAAAKRLWNGEAGEYRGFRVVRSNHIPTLTSAAAASTVDNSDDTGTIIFDKSLRIMVTGVDVNGYERVIYQSSETDTADDANSEHTISVTTPSTTGFTYNVYSSAALTADSTTTATAMTLQAGSLAPATTIKIGSTSGSASASRFVLTTTGAAAPGQLKTTASKIHLSFGIGKEAYAVVDLQSLQTSLTPNDASDSDPLKQRRKAGWKTMFKSVICNNDFMTRIESESAFDG